MVGLLATSKKDLYTTHASQNCCFLCPCPRGRPLPTHASAKDPPTHRQVWLSLLWGHCSFPLGPGVHKILCPPRVSVSPSLVGVLESNPLSFKVRFPGESLRQIPWLESLMWGLELSQQCEQFFSIIVIFFGIICYGWSYIIISSM